MEFALTDDCRWKSVRSHSHRTEKIRKGLQRVAKSPKPARLTQRAPDGAIAPKFAAQFAKFRAIIFRSSCQSAPPVTQTVRRFADYYYKEGLSYVTS